MSEISKKLSALYWNMNICWRPSWEFNSISEISRYYPPFNGTWIFVAELLENLVVTLGYPRNCPTFHGTWIFVRDLLENLIVSQRYQDIIRLLMEREYLLQNFLRISTQTIRPFPTYGTQKLITLLPIAHHWPLSWSRWIRSTYLTDKLNWSRKFWSASHDVVRFPERDAVHFCM
jgi:hypothetical protein